MRVCLTYVGVFVLLRDEFTDFGDMFFATLT